MSEGIRSGIEGIRFVYLCRPAAEFTRGASVKSVTGVLKPRQARVRGMGCMHVSIYAGVTQTPCRACWTSKLTQRP